MSCLECWAVGTCVYLELTKLTGGLVLVCTLYDEQLSFCHSTAPRWKRRLFNLLNYKRSTEH